MACIRWRALRRAFRHGFALFGTALLAGHAQANLANFEGFDDNYTLTNEVVGMQVLNGTVLTAGIGLNEYDFPPTSGVNVLGGLSGSMQLTFDSALTSLSGYFTHYSSLRFLGTDALGAVLFDMISPTDANLGAPELLSFTTLGLKSLQISDDAGNPFVLDDLAFYAVGDIVPEPPSVVPPVTPTPATAAVPEGSTLSLAALGLALMARARKRRPIARG